MEIMKNRETVFFDATNTTSRILQVLEEERPKIVLLDEIDKLPRNFSEKLLGFLESGRVKIDQKNLQLDFELKACKVFATANDINRLSRPLQSRFRKLYLPKYSMEQFLEVAIKVCPKLREDTAFMIGEEVWNQEGDIRDIISIGKLIQKDDDEQEVRKIMMTLTKYGDSEK
jgi:ATP-dependent Lon protease